MCWSVSHKSRAVLLCVLGIVLLPFVVFTQNIIPRFETLSVDDGLSQNSVYSIFQDQSGFMWFGTSNGLNRYDGENIKVFKAKRPSFEKANVNFVRGNLCEDKSGRIWYSNETGIYYFDPIKEEIIRAYDFMSDSSRSISYNIAIALDDNENLWMSTSSNELLKFSVSNKQLAPISLPQELVTNTDYIQYGSRAGNTLLLYLFQERKNLKFDLNSYKFEWALTASDEIIRTEGKQTYIIVKNKFSWYDSLYPSKLNQAVEVPDDINKILKDPYGRIWITTHGTGLYCYYPSDDRLESYHRENSKLKSLPFDITTCLYIDNTNNLWIGTDGGGVARLDLKPSRFEIFPLNQGDHPLLSDYFIRCLYEDERGRIWFGTLHNGLCIYDPVNRTLLKYSHQPRDNNSIPSNKVNTIFKDRDNKIWIGHSKGVSIFDGKNVFKRIPFLPFSQQQSAGIEVNKLIQLQDGRILASTAMGVFYIRKDSRGQYEGIHWDELFFNATDIRELTNGDILMTSRETGLNYFKQTAKGYESLEVLFKGVNTRSIHFDELNLELIWICSGAGLIRFNIKSHDYKLYNYENGMPDNYLYGLLEDRQHNFWMSSNTGLYYFNRSEEKFVNYSVKEGLQSNEFNSRAFHKGASGKFYFGGVNGFNYFDPAEAFDQPTPPRVKITSIQINDKPFAKDSSWIESTPITLDYFENDLAFSFAVLDYTRPQTNQIQYKLEAWDEEFITTTIKNVRYSNLPPGNYTLRIRGSNNGQVWGKEESLQVRISAPFWNTNLFYGGVILILVGGVVMATRSYYKQKINQRLRKLEKQQAILHERERISKDIHDDLGAGLSTIAILSELVKRNSKQDDFTEKQLNKISESSRRLIENLGELIWTHNPSNDSLLKLLWYLREHLSGIFEGTSTTFQILIPENISDRPLQVEWRRNVFLITKEALHNALKHAHATLVDLTVKVSHDSLIIGIRDNGVGFNIEEKMSKGNGLSNMEKRANACGAKLTIESNPEKGTALTISLFLHS